MPFYPPVPLDDWAVVDPRNASAVRLVRSANCTGSAKADAARRPQSLGYTVCSVEETEARERRTNREWSRAAPSRRKKN